MVDLHMPLSKPIAMIYCDSQSAIHIAANSIIHERIKHMEIDCHVVRDKIQSGVVHLLFSNHATDILTKLVAPSPFISIHSKLGMVDFHTPNLRGVVT